MSPSVYITTRTTSKGEKRYVVRFRRGGRMTKAEHAGSFRKRGEALTRKGFVAGELAAGRDPKAALTELAAPAERGTLRQAFDAFIESRVDVAPKTKQGYSSARDRLGRLAARAPKTLAPADVQQWIADCSDLSPGTLKHYLGALRLVLDFVEVEPNPARSKRVKLPSEDSAELSPPTTDEWTAVRETVRARSSLVLRLIEADGLRVSEAVDLTYGDVDFAEGRIRVSRSRTKRRTAGQRWLPVPRELLDEIADLCPLEDRHRERRVFPRLTTENVRDDLERACRDAGVVAYSPHDLRHRRVSLWIAHGFDPVVVKTWTGHTRASITLDVYSHVVIDPNADEWREFWISAYDQSRRPIRLPRLPGEVPVRSERGRP